MMQDLESYKNLFHQHVCDLQDAITQELKSIDPGLELIEDNWSRTDFEGNAGGGGRTRVFNGKVFENAGVNTSKVFGAVNPEFAKTLGGGTNKIWAAGISLIIHPINPRVPSVHMNFRMIQNAELFWFGGGADLTPFYPHVDDFQYFHQVWKKACEPYGCYEEMKKNCDEYFANHHRGNEMRGIGGIFFDHYRKNDLAQDFAMVKDFSNYFIQSYFPLVKKRKDEAFNEDDVDFQLHRRGRYVEFNLLHDRGTTFGLKTGGRTESILVSLPARCKFTYCYKPQNSKHVEMMKYYYPQSWA